MLCKDREFKDKIIIENQKTIMVKQVGEEKHASSTSSWIESWGTDQLQFLQFCLTAEILSIQGVKMKLMVINR